MKRIGYVLSGGGARGFAHLGVMKLLGELGIRPYAISGTSVGAVMGALYAAGKTPEEIKEILKNNKYFGWSNINLLKEGFFSMDVLRKILKNNIKKNDFADLEIKLFVAATDLVKGEAVIFSEGNLFDAVIASASIPIVFEPVKTNGQVLVDGGVLDNFPVEPLMGICDVIIGSHVNKMGKGVQRKSFFKTVDILDRCFHLAIAREVYSKVTKCSIFIETSLEQYDTYNVKKADLIFEAGYNTALLYKDRLIEIAKDIPIAV